MTQHRSEEERIAGLSNAEVEAELIALGIHPEMTKETKRRVWRKLRNVYLEMFPNSNGISVDPPNL